MASNNTTTTIDTLQASKSIVDDLNLVSQRFIIYLPLIFSILGFIGFVGNTFTYLQREFRSNTCCIYSLCGSIIDIINLFLNLFPSYLVSKYGISIPWYTSSLSCKLNLFFLVFLPHLSINFLLLAIIDRFACTCSFTSPIRRLNQLKMVPFMIMIAIIISCLASLYTPILFDLSFGFWCTSTQPITSSVLYIILIGLMQPIVMLIFVLLTYRNVRLSRQRVGGTNEANARQSRTQFIVMIFAQIFTTAFFSLQWIIINYCYYLNNVKAFYVSILTSNLFRKTLIKGLAPFLPRRVHQRMEMTVTMNTIRSVATINQKRNERRM